MEPKVSGLSPMTGPPGTKITVRGENLGQSGDDIISLTINGADCLPYLDWKSSNKLITRCTRAIGSGDIIITTHSGGIGTCDVQFNCYEEVYGLTEESAVWVDEGDFFQAQEKEGSTKPSGLSDDYSMLISSSRFKPELFLQLNYLNASLEDLEQLHKKLQADLAIKSDPEMSSSSNRAVLLKSNLPAIMECLQILEHLNKVITTSRDTSTDNIVRAIKDNLTKTHELFDPLLAQKDLVQSIESTMQVFRQNETLFNLPSAIETSIKTKNYDSVVKEISGVLARLETINIEQSLVRKIRQDVTTKVQELRATIERQLHQSCQSTTSERSIDEVKKLISHLNRLGKPINFDIWIALEEISESLMRTLSERYNYFLKLSLRESENSSGDQKPSITKSPSQNQIGEPPAVVQFVQSAITIFHNTYYDILNLGQSYFDPKDEFACKESNEIRQDRLLRFEETMVLEPVAHLCSLLKSALVPDSEIPSEWPSNETETYATWLKNVLQSVISCHIHLTKVNLPPTVRPALDDFKQFVFDLRVSSMKILFGNATRFNKNLHHKEDWVIKVDDLRGGTTELPLVFEKNVLDTLRFANETIFTTSLPNEKSILIGHDVKASIKESVQSLINSFIDSLDNALIDSKEHPAESTRMLIAGREYCRVASNYTDRLLITICNCKFTEEEIFVRLQDEFEKLPGLKMDRVFKNCSKKYCDYINKISEKFCRIKCAEVKRSLKEAKSGHFEELQINLMIINSQVFLIAPQFVNNLMTSIVNLVRE